nr:13195_t:CDS:2 [Entrophospora candida]
MEEVRGKIGISKPTPDDIAKEAKAGVNIRTSSKIENLFEKTIVSSMLQLDQTY